MESIPIMKHDALQQAVPSVKLALEHVDSDDFFQQLLSIDSALQALIESKKSLRSQRFVLKDKGLTAESAAVQQLIRTRDDLNALILRFKDLQTAARDRFNLRARSLRQNKAGIMNLPGELLRNVFENLRQDMEEYGFWPEFDRKKRTVDIQNVRLTNRKFRDECSHLLIQRLDVSPTLSSLERLENVMRHPFMSQGQRLLRVDMRYYSRDRAESLHEFAIMCHDKLQRETESIERSLKSQRRGLDNGDLSLNELENSDVESDMPEHNMPELVMPELVMPEEVMPDALENSDVESDSSEDSMPEEVMPEEVTPEEVMPEKVMPEKVMPEKVMPDALEDTVMKARRILSSWVPFTEGAGPEDSAHLDEAALALLRSHERYRALVRQQHEILESGHFVRAVAAALAKGHSGGRPNLWLYMSDDEGVFSEGRLRRSWSRREWELAADPDLLIQSTMIQRSPWKDPRVEGEFGDIDEVAGDEEGPGEGPQRLLFQLPLAMRAAGIALAGFKVMINCPSLFNLHMSQTQLSDLKEVARTLERFEFHLDENRYYDDSSSQPLAWKGFYEYLSAAMGQENVPRLDLHIEPYENVFSIGPLLTSPSWQRLQDAKFYQISMEISEFRRLASILQPGVCLQLASITLTEGTWAEALDCLRSKTGWGSYLLDPRGAEAAEMDREDKDSGWRDVFGDEYEPFDPISNATLYMTSEIHKNPLRRYVGAIGANSEL